MNHPLLTRRELLRNSSLGFGGLALSGLYGAPVEPHFQARAKSVIFLFMEGGFWRNTTARILARLSVKSKLPSSEMSAK